MTAQYNDPNYWRARAKELRSMADGIKDEKAKTLIWDAPKITMFSRNGPRAA